MKKLRKDIRNGLQNKLDAQGLETFEANIHYLETAWTENEIKKFVTAVDKKLENLSNHPRIGTSAIRNMSM